MVSGCSSATRSTTRTIRIAPSRISRIRCGSELVPAPLPAKTGDYARLVRMQRKGPAIALAQPLHDTQAQTIALRRGLVCCGPPIAVVAHLVGDRQLALSDDNFDWPLPGKRMLEGIAYQVTNRD